MQFCARKINQKIRWAMRIEIANFKKYLKDIIAIDDETFEMAIDYFKVETIVKGDFLIKEGKACRKIAFVNEGLLRVFYLKEGIEINTSFCLENSITCSFKSLVNQTPSAENIQALENSVIVTLSSEHLIQLFNDSKQWLALRLLLTEKECVRLSDRAGFLSFETALEKYQKLLQLQPELIQRVPIQHLASYIGVSRETISRIRAKV
jgi:CRP-like cAMP-binding protein